MGESTRSWLIELGYSKNFKPNDYLDMNTNDIYLGIVSPDLFNMHTGDDHHDFPRKDIYPHDVNAMSVHLTQSGEKVLFLRDTNVTQLLDEFRTSETDDISTRSIYPRPDWKNLKAKGIVVTVDIERRTLSVGIRDDPKVFTIHHPLVHSDRLRTWVPFVSVFVPECTFTITAL